MLGQPPGQNIAKVAGGHGIIHPFTGAYRALPHQLSISCVIIRNLRHQAANVDGVGAGQPHIRRYRRSKNALDAGLGIIKVALDAAGCHIAAGHGHHLRALHGADALAWVKRQRADAFHAEKPCSAANPVSPLVAINTSSRVRVQLLSAALSSGGQNAQRTTSLNAAVGP